MSASESKREAHSSFSKRTIAGFGESPGSKPLSHKTSKGESSSSYPDVGRFTISMKECEDALIEHRSKEIGIVNKIKKKLFRKKNEEITPNAIKETYEKLLMDPKIRGDVEENDKTIIETLEKIKTLNFEFPEEATELRSLAQLLERLRVNRVNLKFTKALRGADQKLKFAAIDKFEYEKAKMIWLPYEQIVYRKAKRTCYGRSY